MEQLIVFGRSIAEIHFILLILLIAVLLGIVGISLFYFWRYIRLQIRIARNLKRRVYFLESAHSRKIEIEQDSVYDLHLFNIDEEIKDISYDVQSLQSLKNRLAYVVGYEQEYNYHALFDGARRSRTPIIIIADGDEITDKARLLFDSYLYCDVATNSRELKAALLEALYIV